MKTWWQLALDEIEIDQMNELARSKAEQIIERIKELPDKEKQIYLDLLKELMKPYLD